MKTNFLKMIVAFALGLLFLSTPAFAQFTPAQNAYLNKNELLKNPDAENGITNWTYTVKPSISTDYFSGASSFEINPSSQIISFCQSVDTTVKLKNASVSPSCRIKTTISGITLCSVKNGLDYDCVEVNNSGDWEKTKSEVFVTGASSGLCIRSSVPVTGSIKIDNCSLVEDESSSGGILPTALGGTGLDSAGDEGNILTSDGENWVSSPLALGPAHGGTGLSSVGASGNFLVSDGTGWVSIPLVDNVSTINDINTSQQFFAVGFAGTDFNISSVGDTHTFNLPYASITKSGRLSSLDWNIFNSKVDGLSFSIPDELVLFSTNTGKEIKRATGTGVATLTDGVLSTVPAGDSGNVLTSNGTGWISAPATGGGGGGGTASIYNASDLTLTASDSISISSTGTIQRWLLKANSGAITLSSTPFGITPPPDGTEIVVIGQSDTDTVEFTDNDNPNGCIVNGNFVLTKYRMVTFIYNNTLNRYIEKSRNF